MTTCIIFDMDGTILNTLTDIQESVNYAFQLKGLKKQALNDVRKALGNGAKNLIKSLAPSNISSDEFQEIYDLYQSYYDENNSVHTCPYEGIIDLLKELKQNGYKLAVVSNKVDYLVKELNEKMFLGLFDVAIGEVKGITIKPAPDMIYHALKLLNCNQEESIFIGDSEVDIMTAQHANMKSVGVTWGFREKQVLVDQGANHIISKPKDLLSILKRGNYQT